MLILLLVFIGGVLVIFLYVSCLAQNERFVKGSWQKIIPIMILFSFLTPSYFREEVPAEFSLSTSLYSQEFMTMTRGIITYLILRLIVVVKLSKFYLGALRRQRVYFHV